MTDNSNRPELFAKFRLSVDNGFRNEFSFVDYRRWGTTEIWSAGRFRGPPPARMTSKMLIEIWFNWQLIATFASYSAAQAKLDEILLSAPVNLSDVRHYLDI